MAYPISLDPHLICGLLQMPTGITDTVNIVSTDALASVIRKACGPKPWPSPPRSRRMDRRALLRRPYRGSGLHASPTAEKRGARILDHRPNSTARSAEQSGDVRLQLRFAPLLRLSKPRRGQRHRSGQRQHFRRFQPAHHRWLLGRIHPQELWRLAIQCAAVYPATLPAPARNRSPSRRSTIRASSN